VDVHWEPFHGRKWFALTEWRLGEMLKKFLVGKNKLNFLDKVFEKCDFKND